jgi:hypothetical protein
MLPNFLHIGAAKAGSTWLWEVCKEHPEIYVPKDYDNPNFFTMHYHRGLQWYEETYFNNVKDEKAIGEFSNSYSVFVQALGRISRHLSDIRLSVTLRNPIERCYISWAGAHFRKNKYGFDPWRGIGIPLERLLHPNGSTYFRAWIEPGFYADQLRRVYTYFPEERIIVMLYDDLVVDNAGFLKKYFQFLGVDTEFKTTLIDRDINPDEDAAHCFEFYTDDLREEIRKVYRDDISRLQDMIGRDLSHWK